MKNRKQHKQLALEFKNKYKPIIADILMKHDPMRIVYYDNGVLENPGEYDSEADDIIQEIYIRDSFLTKEFLFNAIHRIFCMSFGVFEGHNGEFQIPTMDHVNRMVGDKENYRKVSEEIWDTMYADWKDIYIE